MPVSPEIGSDGVIRLSVKSGGQPIADTVGLVSVRVRRAVGSVASARIVVNDGDMPEGRWTVADGATFAPGAKISIAAGYGDTEEVIFEGLVVQLGMRIDPGNRSQLVVECRHPAVALTVGRRNRIFIDKTDDQVVKAVAGEHGLAVTVAATTVQHHELVQHYASDWDFLLARAEANGLLVLTADDGLKVQAPDVDTAAALKVGWGEDLMEFRAELDARSQLKSVKTVAWDPKQQAVVQGQAARPLPLAALGNLDGAKLAQVLSPADYRLQAPVAASQAELSQWGKAQQLKAALARIRGQMRFQGSAKAQPASLIEVSGVGARYNGSVFVTAIEHEIADGNWITTAEFGQPSDWFCARPDVMAPPASALLPGVAGLQVGVVKKLDGDPATEMRIQVQLPVLDDCPACVWARLASWHASAGFGAFFVPEVGDEVVVGFFNQDPGHAVVLGSLYSSKRKAKVVLEAANDIKSFTTRSGHKFEFDDKDKVITLITPAANKVVLSDKDKSITLQDQNGNKAVLDAGGIALSTPKDVKINAQGSITLDAVGAITLKSVADVKSQGLNVACEAQVGFTGKGSATAELSAAGQTTVKGAIVMIN